MPITPLRDSPAYTLIDLANNAIIGNTALNGIENAKSHFAGRGMSPTTLCSQRVNGTIVPALGVSRRSGQGSNTGWFLGLFQIAVPFTVSPGHNWFTMFAHWRLNKMKEVNFAEYGAVLTFEVMKGGVAAPITFATWRQVTGVSNAEGSTLVNMPIPQALAISPVDTETLYLRVTLDLAEGNRDLDGQSPTAGTLTAANFWNGLNYLTVAAYRNCDGC